MNDKRIPARDVRNICGGVSDMTIWRWLNDPALNFPKPIYIARRRYWKEADVTAWLDAQAEVAA
jgi:predicted DNA-binding transcriptional regulator AlpA